MGSPLKSPIDKAKTKSGHWRGQLPITATEPQSPERTCSGGTGSYWKQAGLWTLNEASFALHVPNSKGPKLRRIKPIDFKSSFLSRMSHEFRAPMHAITSFTKLAQKHLDAARHEKVDTYLQNISLSSSRLMVMLNDLLDLSKLEFGIVDFKIEMGDASDVARQSHEELRSLFEEKELDFQIECSTQNNLIWFDGNKIAQVFINLYSNAIKFSPNQGVIKVYIQEDGIPEESGALHCTISDQGPGIPQSELESIFGEFVQSGSQRNSHGSSGLGLAICREIVTRHGGKIWAENQIKGGAAFHFLLPRSSNNTSAGLSAPQLSVPVPFPSFPL